MKRLLLILSSLWLVACAAGAESDNLSASLAYLRVRSLSDAAPDLPMKLAANHAFVIDLRYTTASEESTGALRTAIAGHPAESPLFILISPATPVAVVDAINRTTGRFVTLGFTGTRSASLIAVKTDAESDRRAYDAVEAGTPVGTLISGKIEKERFDEAALVEEFKNGNPEATPPDPTVAKAAGTADKPPLLVDRVLQRAVHLHQALIALRR